MEQQVENVYLDVTPLHDLFPTHLFSLMTLHSLEPQWSQVSLLRVPKELLSQRCCPLPFWDVPPFVFPRELDFSEHPLYLESIALTLNFISPLNSH